MTSPESRDSPPSPARQFLWKALQWWALLAVFAFVVRRARQLWLQGELQTVRVDVGWLVLAGVVYGAAWLPSVWFWWKLMRSSGSRVRFGDTSRAYYCGHLGKYIPGKAMVLVIRAALLKDRGCSPAPAIYTTGCETLLVMGAGVAVAAAHSGAAFVASRYPAEFWLHQLIEIPFLPTAAALVVLLVVSPLIATLVTALAAKMTPAEALLAGKKVHADRGLVAAGLAGFVGSWIAQGLSLGLTLRAIDAGAFVWGDWPFWTAAVAGATVVGFVAVFAPAGVGVREGLLIETLRIQPAIGEKNAVVAAVLLRIVWLAAEIAIAGILYYLIRPPQNLPVDGATSGVPESST